MKNAVIPGSFDPVTRGHADLFARAAAVFDRVTVALWQNPDKKASRFEKEERLAMLHAVCEKYPNVTVDCGQGLVAEYCKAHDAVLCKGLRGAQDLEYESVMVQYNRELEGVETVFLVTDPALANISSTAVRELLDYGRDPSPYLPPESAALCIEFARK